MNNKKIVVYPPVVPWEEMQQTPHQICKALSRLGYTVFFCNKGREKRQFLKPINRNLFVCYNYEKLTKLLQGKEVILYNSWTRTNKAKQDFNTAFYIYHYLDDFQCWEKEQDQCWKDADLVLCTAEKLYKDVKEKFPSKPVRFNNGADFDLFSTEFQTRPSDLPSGEFIYYHGALHSGWFDYPLINKLSSALPSLNFVFAGKQFSGSFSPSKNIHFLGHKPIADLPKYLSHASACIIPFLQNRITASTDPIKLYEYFAAGKPVISAPLPEMLKYNGAVKFASNEQEWIFQINRAISEQDARLKSERINIARANSWSKKGRILQELIEEGVKRNEGLQGQEF